MTKPSPKFPRGILFFGICEIFIGGWTLVYFIVIRVFLGAMFAGPASVFSKIPVNVFLFIIITSIISFGLGIGILTSNRHARHMLLFFAVMIILSKILIFAGIISLAGALESNIPDQIINTLSMFYHAAILIYFNTPKVRKRFR